MEKARIVRTELVPIGSVQPHPENARRGNMQRIERSLRENGQYRPIVVDEATGYILGGNHTFRVARDKLGWGHIEATFVQCTEARARAILAVDNSSSDDATYDDDALLTLLDRIAEDNLLPAAGFDVADLDDLRLTLADGFPFEGRTDPDEAPGLPSEPPVCATGDVWQLGPHRLVVGDATDPAAWSVALDGREADLLWTDPPYGVDYVGKTKDELRIVNDALSDGPLIDLIGAAFGLGLKHTRPGAAWYVTAPPGPLFHVFADVLGGNGVWRQTLMWIKDQFVLGRSDYHYRHEPILYGWTPGGAHRAPPDRTQDTVHEVDRPKASREHPTMKPVELIEKHLLNSSDAGALVVDPFAGSGSTMIAAHRHARMAAMIELDPRYADVICRRYEEFTGESPVRDGEQVSFTVERDSLE